ncbi:hypothetical protein T4D_14989 [Trichinella pseudospiralis]|uniref:Uncharacterized protein n=1 Tax=Trichinella pseudospiralis TaxID=6337 RepID=A0A0V1DLH6_TRIPS|nr:hypothetical protein T4D_14989 [Trichinella pseudospiralis]
MQLYDSILDNKLHSVPRVLDKREYSERRAISKERRLILNQRRLKVQ